MSIQTNLNSALAASKSLTAALEALAADFGTPTNGTVQPVAGGSAHVAPAVLTLGDMVNVNGLRVHGLGRIVEYIPNAQTYSRKAKTGQSFPQIRVKMASGRKWHFNGEDIANGKVQFARKATAADARSYTL